MHEDNLHTYLTEVCVLLYRCLRILAQCKSDSDDVGGHNTLTTWQLLIIQKDYMPPKPLSFKDIIKSVIFSMTSTKAKLQVKSA